MGNITTKKRTNLYDQAADLPKLTIKCLDVYDRLLRTKALASLLEAGVIKDLAGVINEYVGCPREMLVDVDGDTKRNLAILEESVQLLPDFIECFVRANHRYLRKDPLLVEINRPANLVSDGGDVTFARYAFNTNNLGDTIRYALQHKNAFLLNFLLPNCRTATNGHEICRIIFDFSKDKKRKSAEAFPFFIEAIRLWSNNWSNLDMLDVMDIVGWHTQFRTGQKELAWTLFQHVSPAEKAHWVKSCRESKTQLSSYVSSRIYKLAGDEIDSLKKMVQDFTLETASDWPKLKEKKAEKRKAESAKSGKGKKAKKEYDEFGVETSDGEYNS
jgi:hypothetical protein